MAELRSASSEVRTILQSLENTIELARTQLSVEPPDRENVDFNADNFWSNFITAIKQISHEATKICMIFNGDQMPTNEECRSLSAKVENACLSLLTVFVTIPKTRGKKLYEKILNYVIDSLYGMKNLCAALRTRCPTRLQIVGEIWSHCEAVENLPKDNKDAVVALFREQYETLDDACQELMDSLENEDSNPVQMELSLVVPPNGIQIPPQRWTDSDRNALLPCSGLLKAAKACVKKTMQAIAARGDGTREGPVAELDAIAATVAVSSSLCDDLVLALYPPMNHSAVRGHASAIRDNAKALLQAVKNSHFTTDEAWVEFLEKAVDHNWVRINDLVLTD